MAPALIHPDLTLALSPSRLRALLERHGAKGALPKKITSFAAARALFTGPLPAAARDAFFTVRRFGYPRARDAIVEAAAVVGYALGRRALGAGPADLAASLLLDGKDDAGRAKVLARATIRVDRLFVPLPSFELVGRTPAPPFDLSAKSLHVLEAKVEAALDGDFVALWTVKDAAGRLHAAILYTAPAIDLVTREGDAPVAAAVRPMRCDIVRVDADPARFFLTTERPQHLAPLARAFGAALYGASEGDAFGLGPALSLKRLLELGAKGFRALPRPNGVKDWSIVGCQWIKGDGSRVEVRGPDALVALEANAHVAGGYFSRVTLRVVPDAGAGPVDAFLELPHTLTVSDARHEDVVRGAVAAIGGFAIGTLPDDVHTLAPWVHPEWRWREVVTNKGFDELVATKLVERTKTAALGSKGARALGGMVRVTAIPGEDGVRYATPEGFAAAARDVKDEETQMWRLDVAKLAARLRGALGLAPAPAAGRASNAGKERDGLVELGHLVGKSGRVRVVYAMSRPPKGVVAAVRRECKLGTVPLFLVPFGRTIEDEGIHQVELELLEQFALGDGGEVLERIVDALDLSEEIELPARMKERAAAKALAELVLERSTGRLFLTGVPLDALPERAAKMLLFLVESAQKGRPVVSVRELGNEMSSNTVNPDVMVRQTRQGLARWLSVCFASSSKRVPEGLVERLITREGRGMYRIGVSSSML